MGNIFDAMKNSMFDVTTTTMGYDATWTPSTGGDEQSARVHLREPNDKEILRKQEYLPERPVMEYRSGFFSGLYELVKQKKTQTITIEGVNYKTTDNNATWDGDTYKVDLIKA